jgi:GMP synthase-like glutamine amidotransferase
MFAMRARTLKLCLVDMNNGVANEATRCFRRLFDAFSRKVTHANPGLEIHFRHVQPRNLGELPSPDVDLVLSSGGPGAPSDGYEDPWCTGYRHFLDHVVERTLADPLSAPAALVVCHSFEVTVAHFAVAEMVRREHLKFGVFPCYPTPLGQKSPLFAGFGDRLFTWEHRRYEAVNLDERRLRELGGRLLAVESRPGGADKGQSLLGFEFAPGIVGTQFHPEADRPGVLAWIHRVEHATAVKEAYGHHLYERMIKTLEDPSRLARTYALFIPGWLARRFNAIAPAHGWSPIEMPEQDMAAFEAHEKRAV